MSVVIAESHGALFGFCSQLCAQRFLRGEPAIEIHKKGNTFACWLCQADLTSGAHWLPEQTTL